MMVMRILKILWNNLGTILTAFILAVVVWVSAVIADDPNEERDYPFPVPLEVINLPEGMIVVGQLPQSVEVSLSAPQSLWEQMMVDDNAVHAQLDLSGLKEGEYRLSVDVIVSYSPVRVSVVTPAEIGITLEKKLEISLEIQPKVIGEPALGFNPDRITLSQQIVSVSGPESLVSQVDAVFAELDITEAKDTLFEEVTLKAVDADGQQVAGITLDPNKVNVTQTFLQSGGYRDVAVKVETKGQVASGYRVTNISVSPPTVTVYSSDPQIVAQMPGFVSTQPLDLTEANASIETGLVLALPNGVVLVSEEKTVHVTIEITVIQSSLSIQIPIELIGLGSGLSAQLSPEGVDVILSGPLPTLDTLVTNDVVIVVDLTGLEEGTHLLSPEAVTLPEGVTIDSIIPETIEVIISLAASTQ
jgi:YbbR domain-containing protein